MGQNPSSPEFVEKEVLKDKLVAMKRERDRLQEKLDEALIKNGAYADALSDFLTEADEMRETIRRQNQTLQFIALAHQAAGRIEIREAD